MMPIQQIYIIGSKWLYLKIYTGTKTADKILIHHIYTIIHTLFKKDYIDKWFFIRYEDPDFHLRVRLLVRNESFIGEIISLLYNKLNLLIRQNIIWKIQFDTYVRELERYGNVLIEEAESIFHIDSECVLSILKKLDRQDENFRWMIALQMIDKLLSDFSLNLTEKKQLMNYISDSFKTEFGFNQYNTKQFNVKYREHKDTIERVLNIQIDNHLFNLLYLPINKRSKQLKPIIQNLEIK